MSIPIKCECGFADKVPDKWAGKRVKCKCGRKILVPQPASAGSKSASEQKSNSSNQATAATVSKTSSKNAGPQKPAATTGDAGKKSSDDLSELVAGDLPTELKKPKPAAVKSKATTGSEVEDLDLVEEFEELEELDELEELPPESGLDELDELDDDLDDFDMRETDDLDMTEPTVEKPAKKPAEEKVPEKKSVPVKPKPDAKKKQPKPVAPKEQPKPAPKKEQPKPVAAKEQPKPDAKKEQPKPVATKESPKPDPKKEQPKPISGKTEKSTSRPSGGTREQNEPAKVTGSSKENLTEKRDSIQPAEKTSKKPVAKETASSTDSVSADAVKVAIPSGQAASPVDRQDAPPPPAHAPAMVKADVASVNITLDVDQPAIVETGAPKLSVGSPGGSSLTGRQKAKRKSDIIRWVVMGVIAVVACGFFGVIFLIGSLLDRFETPAVIPEDQQKAEESADSMLVPGADSTPPVEDKKAATDGTETKEPDAAKDDAAKDGKADPKTDEAKAEAAPE